MARHDLPYNIADLQERCRQMLVGSRADGLIEKAVGRAFLILKEKYYDADTGRLVL